MLSVKIFHLTKLLKLSHRTVVVTKSPPDTSSSSSPSSLHHQLVGLERAGLVQTAISLDHWALLQKAGFPQVRLMVTSWELDIHNVRQHKVIEVVGSKFDPSNPPHPEDDEEKKVTCQTVKSLLEREVR